jgi:hypothetical protein
MFGRGLAGPRGFLNAPYLTWSSTVERGHVRLFDCLDFVDVAEVSKLPLIEVAAVP